MKIPVQGSRIIIAFAGIAFALQTVSWCPAQRYIPPPGSVTISPRTNGPAVSVSVRVDLPTPCESVDSWGTALRAGSTVLVDAEFWSQAAFCVTIVKTVYHQYNLGALPPGEYNFVFRAWGTLVKTQTFSVGMPEQLRLSIHASQVELCWNTANNAWYQLQFCPTLTANQWTPLTPWFPGNGGLFCTNEVVNTREAQRYYRVARTNAPPAP